MAFTRGLFVRPDSTRGTTPVEARKALEGILPNAGVLDGMTVKGTTEWAYEIGAGHFVTKRGNDGSVAAANDAPTLVATSPAPGTGSRIDIIYVKHNDVDFVDNSSAIFADVAMGVASGTPVAPNLPPGALELARKTVAAGDANTSAGAAISHANTPQAQVGRQVINLGAGKTTTQVDFTNAQGEVNLANVVTGTVVNGKIRATVNATVSASAAPLLIKLILRTVTGVVIGTGQVRLEAAGGPGQETVSFTVQENVPTGGHTFQIRGQIVSGTGTASLLPGAQLIIDDYR